ncbi:MAG: FAD-dependent oxidoreductase [Solirubrobacteraceae bacterium]|nr:FAD-dependent oxidoreductase [Solirubrobacteraceae bacterium]
MTISTSQSTPPAVRDGAPRRVAVVGGGVAGLVSADLLRLAGHQVVVFEAEDRPGGHACSVDVAIPEGGTVPADVGFMVFNDRNYPHFEALIDRLGVRGRVSDMSFSVSDGADFEYAGHGLGALFANRRHLVDRQFLKMVGEYVRFSREGKRLLASDDDPTLAAWLEAQRFSRHFIDRLIVPQATAVWSADPAQMWDFPARFLLQFFANHGMLSLVGRPTWHTVAGSSARYVRAITRGLDVRVSSPVARVARLEGGGVEITVAGAARGERFDEAVLACHSDQALSMLAEPTPAEREVLGAIAYLPSEVVLHGDASLLPRRAAARASWNAHLTEPAKPLPTVTYDLKRLQGLPTRREILVTLNRTEDIDAALIDARFSFSHPVFSTAGVAAQRRHAEISGADRIHYAGAYWRWGFHEDGVWSAHRVADAFGAAVPTGGAS